MRVKLLQHLIVVAAVALPGLSCQAQEAATSEGAPPPDVAPSHVFDDGDHWAAVGDELTQSGTYHEWVALYYLTRFPDRLVDVRNAGLAGDTATTAGPRVGWDVLDGKPRVVSLLFGANDVDRALYRPNQTDPELAKRRRERLAAYRSGQGALIRAAQDSGARVIVFSPPPYDEKTQTNVPVLAGLDAALAECARISRELASESGALFVDLHAGLSQLKPRRKIDPFQDRIIDLDRIRPTAAGHLLIAWLLLKEQGVPAEVASLTIDLREGQFVATNSEVQDVVRTSRDLTFLWTAKALPLPLDVGAVHALAWAPVLDDLSRESLRVAGLAPGAWDLFIDGRKIKSYTHDQLEAGVNLGLEPTTPQYEQAQSVMKLLDARTELIADNLRPVALVEHRCAPDIEHPVTLEIMQPHLAAAAPRLAAGELPGLEPRSLQLYPARKTREAGSITAAARLYLQAQRAAQPLPHLYALRPAR